MKLLIIAATGRTGKLVVEQGIKRGHDITALTRHPEALSGLQGLAGIVEDDALDLDTVRKAVQGQDAVICAVSNSGITLNLVKAMTEAGVRRVIVTSSRSVVATAPKIPVALAWMFFRGAYADNARAEGMLQASDLEWSIVRGTMLTDKPGVGRVHIDFEANATGGDWTLTRADYAMTLLDVAENPKMIRKALGVCGPKPASKAQSSSAQVA